VPYTAPRNITGGGGKSGDLTVKWTPLPGEEQNAPGIHYKIYWRRLEIDPERDYQHKVLSDLGNAGLYVIMIPKQYYYTKYGVILQAINSVGAGPKSEEAVVYSAEDIPQVPPTEVGARAHNSTSIRVTWIPVDDTRENMRGQLTGYRVKYWRSQDEERNSLFYLSRSTDPEALIVGLTPDTRYFVKVMAYNDAGPGPESERSEERTFKKAPQKPPTAVKVEAYDPNTVKVTWRYVTTSTDEEPLLGYRVVYWDADQDIETADYVEVLLGQTLEAYVRNLKPKKRYKLRVYAFSNGGEGTKSSPAWEFQMGRPEDFK
jgi:hypothetical protein